MTYSACPNRVDSTLQLSIDFPRARASDPATSHLAASNASKFAESHAGRIHLALIGKNLTAHELSTITGLSVVQIDRRLPDLKRAGLARVQRLADGDVVRGGFRVWEATK
jgi:hypothetical protein